MSTSLLEIKSDAIRNNILFLQSTYGNETRISVVVKGNAYGHGIETVLPVFENSGVDHFSVFSCEEAQRVFLVKSKRSTLMIMGYIDAPDLEWVIKNKVEFYIFEPGFLEKAIQVSKRIGLKAKVHLEIETGMYRTGMTRRELSRAIEILDSGKNYIEVAGISTHLAGAESIANYHRINSQLKLFNKRVHFLRKKNIQPKQLHAASSAASISYPRSRMSLVRAGIISYGFWPTREIYMQYTLGKKLRDDPLQRAIRWKSRIMSIKEVPQGEFIGYGYNFQAPKDMRVAIIPVGYSDGYSRQLSNNGHVLIHTDRADVIGSVNMNMIIVNVTEIPDVKCDDEVILLGAQGDNEISVASFSEMNNSMNYELLSRLPESIKRVVI